MKKIKTLVLGASLKPARYSNKAIRQLRKNGHAVIAIGLRKGVIEDVSIEKGLPYFDDVDTVTIYLGEKNQGGLYDYLIRLRPRRVIFNPGAENPKLYKQLKIKGIDCLNACTLVMLSIGDY